MLIGPSETNFSEILIKFGLFSVTKMDFKISSEKWRPFCINLNMLARLFTQPFIQAQIQENINAPRHWPLYGEFTGHR